MKCKASRCTGQRIQTASVPDTMLTTGITALFSLTCALAVANVYSAQPLLDSMAVSLKVSPGMIGSVITATQAGYAIGLLFLVPLGDWLNRKYVVMSQLLLSVAALVAAGLSPNIATLLGAMLIVGLMAVVVQVLVAWVAILATPQKRGQAVGTLTSGIVSGILLSRFISGAIADIAGWRAVYLTAACLMLVIAGVVWKIMPSPRSSRSRKSRLTFPY
ncbi:major facilitator transporter [Klebsiella pneumoniae subsp. ozaenae]|uniref:Major facilitator transporter n=1 Tax=Klebsiella pneumoniae subsp. ozaenae TaxID=574 RepID=A0A377ZJN7_KLEPO|nr:major facilitator transporter [Klebsiella pneumoniae subsp. ozaenae]